MKWKRMQRENLRTAVGILSLAMSVSASFGSFACPVMGQNAIRQVPAPLPKLVLSSSSVTVGVASSQKIWLTISNWDRYSTDMFELPSGARISAHPCPDARSRVVISVYGQKGDLLSGCILARRREALGRIPVPLQKGKLTGEFVYIVINDRYTGAAYRSNMVSPHTGATR